MSTHAVKLDEQHFRAAEAKALALGTTPDEFVSRLIETEETLGAVSFDELLAPVRKGFEHLSDDQLDALFVRTKKQAIDRGGE